MDKRQFPNKPLDLLDLKTNPPNRMSFAEWLKSKSISYPNLGVNRPAGNAWGVSAELAELRRQWEKETEGDCVVKEHDEAIRVDAARYRWLRSQKWNDGKICVVVDPKDSVKLGRDCPCLDRLDRMIDEAMEQSSDG